VRLQEKEQVVAELGERLARASVTVLAVPRGLTVAQVTKLRKRVRELSGEYKIAKNSLALRAVEATDFSPLKELLEGPTALVFGYGDPVAIVKEIVRYSTENSQHLEIKGAVLDGQFYGREQITELARLGSKDQLRARLVGVLASPATQLARLLSEPATALARVLAAREASGAPDGGEALSSSGDADGRDE
jgi:large subunit ribosomal protein L10